MFANSAIVVFSALRVKRRDYLQQTAVKNYAQAMTPLIKALDFMQSNRDPEATKKHVMDSLKVQRNMSWTRSSYKETCHGLVQGPLLTSQEDKPEQARASEERTSP